MAIFENLLVYDEETIKEKIISSVDKNLSKMLINKLYQFGMSKENEDRMYKYFLARAVERTMNKIIEEDYIFNINTTQKEWLAILNTLIKSYIFIFFTKYADMLKMYIKSGILPEDRIEQNINNTTDMDKFVVSVKSKLIKNK